MEQPFKSNGGIYSCSPFFVAGLMAGDTSRHRTQGREGIDLLKAGASAGRDYIGSCGADLRDLVKGTSGPTESEPKAPAAQSTGLTA